MKNKAVFMQNLKKLRISKGLSQQELARKCGFSKMIISHYESNASNPSVVKIETISKILGVTIADLLNDHLTTNKTDLSNIDPRIIKKIIKIKALPVREQNKVWDYANTILEKNELKQKNNQLQEIK